MLIFTVQRGGNTRLLYTAMPIGPVSGPVILQFLVWQSKKRLKNVNTPISIMAKDSIVCDSCLTWFHFHCISLKGPPKSKLWYCQTCYIVIDKLWNFIAVSMIAVHLSLRIFKWVWFYILRYGFDCQTNNYKIMSSVAKPIGTAIIHLLTGVFKRVLPNNHVQY